VTKLDDSLGEFRCEFCGHLKHAEGNCPHIMGLTDQFKCRCGTAPLPRCAVCGEELDRRNEFHTSSIGAARHRLEMCKNEWEKAKSQMQVWSYEAGRAKTEVDALIARDETGI
jgi:hypothetical protein